MRSHAGGFNYIYMEDGIGSITEVTDWHGNVRRAYVYDSFGNTAIQTGTLNPTNPFKYTGRELDEETGLYYYRARYYDPEIGRFLQEDPIGFEGGDINLYVYVSNNPVNLTDPLGLRGIVPFFPYGPGPQPYPNDPCCEKPTPNDPPFCDYYGNEKYGKVGLKCFCECAGNTAWDQYTRGCLKCKDQGGDSTFDAHVYCYEGSTARGLLPPVADIFICTIKCWQ